MCVICNGMSRFLIRITGVWWLFFFNFYWSIVALQSNILILLCFTDFKSSLYINGINSLACSKYFP